MLVLAVEIEALPAAGSKYPQKFARSLSPTSSATGSAQLFALRVS